MLAIFVWSDQLISPPSKVNWLKQHNASPSLIDAISKTLQLDRGFCPRYGGRQHFESTLGFDGKEVSKQLAAMELPAECVFLEQAHTLNISTPGGRGDFLKGPDGGSCIKGEIVEAENPDIIAIS